MHPPPSSHDFSGQLLGARDESTRSKPEQRETVAAEPDFGRERTNVTPSWAGGATTSNSEGRGPSHAVADSGGPAPITAVTSASMGAYEAMPLAHHVLPHQPDHHRLAVGFSLPCADREVQTSGHGGRGAGARCLRRAPPRLST